MNALQGLVYVSSAVGIPTVDELHHLLQRARARNVNYSITGLLLYNDGNFMQYIEGAPAPLATIYSIICDDPMHHEVTELYRQPAAERLFPGWLMAFRSTEHLGENAVPAVDQMLLPRPRHQEHTEGVPQRLLRDFWNRRRPAR